jgi:RHH-type rel operon transcriptional repressor/antitoxin RelB
MPQVSLRLSDSITKRLNHLASRTGRSKTFYVTRAVLEYIDDLEDVYIAEKRLEDLRVGRSYTVSLEDAMKRAGIAVSENDLVD